LCARGVLVRARLTDGVKSVTVERGSVSIPEVVKTDSISASSPS